MKKVDLLAAPCPLHPFLLARALLLGGQRKRMVSMNGGEEMRGVRRRAWGRGFIWREEGTCCLEVNLQGAGSEPARCCLWIGVG
jgi:hypothetical protein